MNVVRLLSLSACMTLVFAASGQAQERIPFSRAYLSAFAGASFDSDTKAVFAGEYGERVSDLVMAYVNISYHDDLMSDVMRGYLADAGALLTDITATSYQFQGRDRGIAFTFGGKVELAPDSRVRPYVGGGVGGLHLRRNITERTLGDVTDSFVAELGASDGNIDSTRVTATKPLVEALLGVGFYAGRRTYVDVGYRYRRAFHTVEAIDFSQLTAGVGVRF